MAEGHVPKETKKEKVTCFNCIDSNDFCSVDVLMYVSMDACGQRGNVRREYTKYVKLRD